SDLGSGGSGGPRDLAGIHGLSLDQPRHSQPAAHPYPRWRPARVPHRRSGAAEAVAARAAPPAHTDRVRGATGHHDPRDLERYSALAGPCLPSLEKRSKGTSRGTSRPRAWSPRSRRRSMEGGEGGERRGSSRSSMSSSAPRRGWSSSSGRRTALASPCESGSDGFPSSTKPSCEERRRRTWKWERPGSGEGRG